MSLFCLGKSSARAALLIAFVVACLWRPGWSQARDAGPEAPPKEHGWSPLRRGTNEFGMWGGYSPFSFVLKGTSKDRQLLLLNLQYARTLFATRPVTLKYTADIVPVELEFQPTQQYVADGAVLTNPAATVYGAGANPIGFQANFGSRRIEPIINGSLGFVYFDRQVPIVGSSQFNYNITVGFGAQFFPRAGRTFAVGWRYHHLSNNYQAHLNPGIDSGIFYVGFSVFRVH